MTKTRTLGFTKTRPDQWSYKDQDQWVYKTRPVSLGKTGPVGENFGFFHREKKRNYWGNKGWREKDRGEGITGVYKIGSTFLNFTHFLTENSSKGTVPPIGEIAGRGQEDRACL